jgi:hypothetical protein
MLLTLCVALTTSSLSVWNTSMRTARQLAAERAKLSLAEAHEAARDRQIQAEFFGHSPPPILAIDPKMDAAVPILVAYSIQSIFHNSGLKREEESASGNKFDLIFNY